MATPYDNSGLLPSGVLQPYGQNILKYGIGQLGTPIDVGALTPKVAGQTAFQQQAQQGIANQSGLGDIQRDASGMVTGFTGGTGVASYQPYLNQMSQFNTAASGFGQDAAGFAQNAVGFGTDAAGFGQNAAGFNTAAADLADPSQDYQSFMSPYQQEIINTTLADYDRQAQIGRQGVSQNAYTAGAFGGSRQGVAEAEYQSNSDRNRAAILAGLYGQGYNSAQDLRQQAMSNQLGLGDSQLNLGANQLALGNNQLNLGSNQLALGNNQLNLGSVQQGLASLVPGLEQQNLAALDSIGQQDQLLEQSKLNAIAQANQSAYQLPLDRITDVSNIYGSVSGAMPGSPTQKFQPNPLLTGIGGFANMYTTLGGSAMTRSQQPGQFGTSSNNNSTFSNYS